jgi:hypothetical protein
MSGGGGSDGTSTTTQSIPDELKPLASAYSSKAIDLGSQSYSPYTGQRYTGLNSNQNQAIQMVKDRATNGSATMDNAESNLNQIISGNESNPYLDTAVQKAQDSVTSNFNTSAINSGSFGNTGTQQQYAQNLNDTATNMYNSAYQQDQDRRLSAINSASTFGNQAYTDASQLAAAGQTQQDQDQQNLDYGYSQYQENQNLPYKQLAAMSGVFGSNLGGTSTTTQNSSGGK